MTQIFERIQFKRATSKGKRRKEQEYFQLLLELCVDVRKVSSTEPCWVQVAQLISEEIVVRGRVPSYYAGEGQRARPSLAGGASSSSSQKGTGIGLMAMLPGPQIEMATEALKLVERSESGNRFGAVDLVLGYETPFPPKSRLEQEVDYKDIH